MISTGREVARVWAKRGSPPHVRPLSRYARCSLSHSAAAATPKPDASDETCLSDSSTYAPAALHPPTILRQRGLEKISRTSQPLTHTVSHCSICVCVHASALVAVRAFKGTPLRNRSQFRKEVAIQAYNSSSTCDDSGLHVEVAIQACTRTDLWRYRYTRLGGDTSLRPIAMCGGPSLHN
ncbi:hypothetical protein QAD02_018644 [Eretmocerus hayati]|uniref:Uncharacterized protein n=1 Tax=Eretmocerus hayati TaxID=131215 RepID=A0ACC2PHL8_9HYME|nr:hypothetical protein QAD02_018644 [Eretmocerus hayati]